VGFPFKQLFLGEGMTKLPSGRIPFFLFFFGWSEGGRGEMIADFFVIGSARIETSIKDLQEQGEAKKMEVRKLLLFFSLLSLSPSLSLSPPSRKMLLFVPPSRCGNGSNGRIFYFSKLFCPS
jgi:hypothetical protein